MVDRSHDRGGGGSEVGVHPARLPTERERWRHGVDGAAGDAAVHDPARRPERPGWDAAGARPCGAGVDAPDHPSRVASLTPSQLSTYDSLLAGAAPATGANLLPGPVAAAGIT